MSLAEQLRTTRQPELVAEIQQAQEKRSLINENWEKAQNEVLTLFKQANSRLLGKRGKVLRWKTQYLSRLSRDGNRRIEEEQIEIASLTIKGLGRLCAYRTVRFYPHHPQRISKTEYLVMGHQSGSSALANELPPPENQIPVSLADDNFSSALKGAIEQSLSCLL